MKYRADINGLRAYAVLAVMLFHFGVPGFRGGFIGVDVFFVISGFLMTQIIAGGIASRTFSLWKFYAGRARRIIPALIVLCALLLVIGWFWLGPSDYAMLGKHAAAAASFTSNFTFKDEEGYFDSPAATKWLLHTWSLSVEFQFYLIYPLLMILFVHKQRERSAGPWLIGIAMLSFASCVLAPPRLVSFAFYMLPARAFELIAGGLVYLYANDLPLSGAARRTCEVAGFALIAVSAFLIDSNWQWPGALTFFPVFGAALVLAAAEPASLLTANIAAARIGKWSYSIYLWHWPVVVALEYFGLRSSPVAIVLGFAASIALGAASCAFIEQPARRYFSSGATLTGAAALTSIAIIASAGLFLFRHHGIPSRVDPRIAMIDSEADNFFHGPENCGVDKKTLTVRPCILGDAHNVKWVFWGDSHAGAVLGAVEAALKGGIIYYPVRCPVLSNAEPLLRFADRSCPALDADVLRQVNALPANVRVLILDRYSQALKGKNEAPHAPFGFAYRDLSPAERKLDPFTLYRQHFVATMCEIASTHALTLLGPIPEMGIDVPKTLVRRLMSGRPAGEVSISRSEYFARQDEALVSIREAVAKCHAKFLDPVPYLCDETRCYGSRNGQPLYRDDNHLSETGSRQLIPLLATLNAPQ